MQKENHQSDAIHESEEVSARNIIRSHAEKLGTTFAVMQGWPKTHPEKTNIALELRKKTTLSVSWIAEELNAGKPATLWNQMRLIKNERSKGAGLPLTANHSAYRIFSASSSLTISKPERQLACQSEPSPLSETHL